MLEAVAWAKDNQEDFRDSYGDLDEIDLMEALMDKFSLNPKEAESVVEEAGLVEE